MYTLVAFFVPNSVHFLCSFSQFDNLENERNAGCSYIHVFCSLIQVVNNEESIFVKAYSCQYRDRGLYGCLACHTGCVL